MSNAHVRSNDKRCFASCKETVISLDMYVELSVKSDGAVTQSASSKECSNTNLAKLSCSTDLC
jgi:hypothetical protein